MFTFAQDVIDLFEVVEMTVGKSFLVWNEQVGFSCAKPAGEDAFEKNIGIVARCAGEKPAPW